MNFSEFQDESYVKNCKMKNTDFHVSYRERS